jgi:hypothetical protein
MKRDIVAMALKLGGLHKPIAAFGGSMRQQEERTLLLFDALCHRWAIWRNNRNREKGKQNKEVEASLKERSSELDEGGKISIKYLYTSCVHAFNIYENIGAAINHTQCQRTDNDKGLQRTE